MMIDASAVNAAPSPVMGTRSKLAAAINEPRGITSTTNNSKSTSKPVQVVDLSF